MIKLRNGIIENLGNIEKEEFNFSAINIWSGRNATGKSSRINAISSVFKKGDNKELIRQGCESGYCELYAVDGEDEQRYLKKFFIDKPAKLQVWINGHEQSAPQRFFDMLRDGERINLHSWLSLKDDAKGKVLLDSMPLKVDMKKINDMMKNITGGNRKIIEMGMLSEDVHAMEFVDKIEKTAFTLRTDENRQLGKDEATLENLELSIEEFDSETDWTSEANKLDIKIQKLQSDRYTEQEKIQGKYQKQIETAKDNKYIEEEKIQTKYRKQIDDLKQKMNDELSEKVSLLENQINELSIERAESNVKAEEYSRIKVITEQITNTKEDIKALDHRSTILTQFLKSLEYYRISLLENIPIKGVSFDKGILTLDGLPLGSTNTARLIELSLEVTALKMPEGGLRFAYVDGIEALDTDQLKKLIELAMDKDIELLMGKTADTDLELLNEDSFE